MRKCKYFTIDSIQTKYTESPFRLKVLFERQRAVGIEYVHNGRLRQVRAKKEVILSAGAIGSPQLLMLSGVGPRHHLEDLQVSRHTYLWPVKIKVIFLEILTHANKGKIIRSVYQGRIQDLWKGGRSGYRERRRREGFWRVPFEDPLWNFKRGGAPCAPPESASVYGLYTLCTIDPCGDGLTRG